MLKSAQPRFVVKFNNGYHKVFDTLHYEDVGLCYLLKDAVEAAANLNKGR